VAEDTLDMALCMSVNPGWSGQKFIPGSVSKLSRLRAELPDHVALEVDGGINKDTAPPCVQAGANLLVAASAVFDGDDPGAAFAALAAKAGAE
jgi:ribulose-phosphate 3-epimerase